MNAAREKNIFVGSVEDDSGMLSQDLDNEVITSTIQFINLFVLTDECEG